MKFLITLLLVANIMFAQGEKTQETNSNIVKTSELELFLFKVGFQGLLKDVELTKDKTKLNADDINILNKKIDLIAKEIYKNKKILKPTDSTETLLQNDNSKEEYKELKAEIEQLKQQITKLKVQKSVKKDIELPNEEKIRKNDCVYKVRVSYLNVRTKPSIRGKIFMVLSRGTEFRTSKLIGNWAKISKIYNKEQLDVNNSLDVRDENIWIMIKNTARKIKNSCKN